MFWTSLLDFSVRAIQVLLYCCTGVQFVLLYENLFSIKKMNNNPYNLFVCLQLSITNPEAFLCSNIAAIN